MAYFGVDRQARIEELNMKFNQQIRAKGKGGPSGLKEIFKNFDENKNGTLETGEFEEALASFG
jgi:hypothetical protein